MLIYLVFLIIGLVGFGGVVALYGNVKKKYRKLLKKIMSVCLVFFLIGGINLTLEKVGEGFLGEEEIATLEENVDALQGNIALKNSNIEDLEDFDQVLSDEEIREYYNEYKSLSNDLNENANLLTSLESEYNKLDKEYQTLYDETSYLIDGVITYHQYPNYPNGCESVALYILLQYYGVDVTVEEIVEALPKGSSPHRVNGVLYAGNPLREFVGDPRLYTGYGVFEEPIIEVANQFKEGMINYTGHSLDDVLSLVHDGHPVQVWASINMEDTDVCVSWIDEDTGEKVDWICDLHSLVVIGYDYKSVITSDSYTGEIETYDRDQFEKMYNLFGKRALYYEE